MSDGQKQANDAEAWRSNAQSRQRESITKRVNNRQGGEVITPELTTESDDAAASSDTNTTTDWNDRFETLPGED